MSELAFSDAPESELSEQLSPTPGAVLAAEREMRGLSVEDVAAQLNLAPRQIYAIEAGDYAALPGMASVRGFIRGYAKTLKIDAAPLLAMIPSSVAPIPEQASARRVVGTPFSESRLPTIGRGSGPSRSVVVLCVFVALLGIGWFAQHKGWLPGSPESISNKLKDIASSTSSAAPGTTIGDVTKTPAIDAPDLQAHPSAGNVATVASNMPPAPAMPLVSASSLPAISASIASQKPVAESAMNQAAIPLDGAGGGNKLVLKLREDSWVEAVRSNKTAVISRLVKAGSTEVIELSEPLSLTIGNASGVDATLRGKLLDLKSGSKTNVARLSLK